MRKRNLTLPDEMNIWLKQHPEINFSGLVQVWLSEFIQTYEEKVLKCEVEQNDNGNI